MSLSWSSAVVASDPVWTKSVQFYIMQVKLCKAYFQAIKERTGCEKEELVVASS